MEGPSRVGMEMEGGSPVFSSVFADQQATYDLMGWAKITVYDSIVDLSPDKSESKGMIKDYLAGMGGMAFICVEQYYSWCNGPLETWVPGKKRHDSGHICIPDSPGLRSRWRT